jgi:hypothetical protein
VSLEETLVIRNDSSFLALSAIESSFSSAMRVPSHYEWSRTDSREVARIRIGRKMLILKVAVHESVRIHRTTL